MLTAWVVVVSINPPDGTYQVAPLDRPLIDRMVILYVESDCRCWARYATSRDFDPEVLSGFKGKIRRRDSMRKR